MKYCITGNFCSQTLWVLRERDAVSALNCIHEDKTYTDFK
jgi:hypothetical protein